MVIEQSANELEISKRSAYYGVCNINVWLEQADLPPLETECGHGVLLPFENRERIETLLSKRNTEEVYTFSPEEQVKLIILYVH